MIWNRKILHAVGMFLFFSLLWWAFTDGSSHQLWLGPIVVLLGVAAWLVLAPHGRFPRFSQISVITKVIPYFIYQSIHGGLLVARLAVSPQERIRSQFFEYETSIPAEASLARMWFAGFLCIFLGTLSCGFRGNTLVIHVLDLGLIDPPSVRGLEEIIEQAFGLSLPDSGPQDRT